MVRPVKLIVQLIQNVLFKIGCFKAFKLKYDCAKIHYYRTYGANFMKKRKRKET